MGLTRLPFTKKSSGPAKVHRSTIEPASGPGLNLAAQPGGPVDAPVRQVVVFFAITYAFTWAFFLAARSAPTAPRTVLILVGAFGPSLVAIVLTARGSGRAGVKELLGRLLKWRVRLRWYAFALGYMAAVKLVVAVLFRLGHGRWPHFGEHSVATILVLIVVAGIIGGPLGEEIGWRGYALPRLTQRFGLAPAGLVLGVVWSFWHLPVFVMSIGGDQFGQSFPAYLLQVTALSVAMAWLMGNTSGSLLLAVLFHSAINQTKDLVPSLVVGAHHAWGAVALSSSSVAWLTDAVLWVGAAYFLTRMPWHPSSRASVATPSATTSSSVAPPSTATGERG